jgi:AcrR family transcriptional regulator
MMKEAIFQAAVTVLAERGVEGMTMDRVAVAAGVAKGSLYKYFTSKKSLLEFVYSRVLDPLFAELEEIVAAEQAALEKLQLYLHKILDHIGQHSRVMRLLFEDDTAHGLLQSSERRTHERGSQRLAQIFRQGMTEGTFHTADPVVLARMFIGLCRGVFETQPELGVREQRDAMGDLILRTFLRGAAIESG